MFCNLNIYIFKLEDVEKWDIERMDTVRNAITRLQILNRGKIKFTTEIKDDHIFVYRIK